MHKPLKVLFAVGLLASFTSQAAFISYNNEAAFTAAAASYTSNVENFDSDAAGTTISSGSALRDITYQFTIDDPISGNPFDIVIDNQFGTTSPDNYLGLSVTDDTGTYIESFLGGDEVTFIFNQPIFGFGLYVITTDELFDGDITFSTDNYTVALDATNSVSVGQDVAYFLGFIQDDANQSFNTVNLSSLAENFFFNLDDIHYLSAASVNPPDPETPIPAPASLSLLGLGLCALYYRRRQGRAKSSQVV